MATQDPELVRLVAARYPQMQGLRRIADATWPLLLATALSATTEYWHLIPFGVAMVFLMWSRWTWLNRWLHCHYAERFGRVGDPSALYLSDLGMASIMTIGANDTLRDVFHAPDYVRAAIIMTALCAYPLWIAVRDFSYRSYWLLLVIAGIAVSVQIPWVPKGDAHDIWVRDAYLAIGLGLLAVGALDHLLLVRALGGGSSDGVTEDVSI